MIIGVQIIGLLFGFLMTYLTFLYYRRKEFNRSQLLFWEFLWIIFVFIVLFPNVLSSTVKELGFTRVFDFLTIMGFVIITFLTFYNYNNINKLKKKLEANVRKDAIKKIS